jgi:hypothetical protein
LRRWQATPNATKRVRLSRSRYAHRGKAPSFAPDNYSIRAPATGHGTKFALEVVTLSSIDGLCQKEHQRIPSKAVEYDQSDTAKHEVGFDRSTSKSEPEAREITIAVVAICRPRHFSFALEKTCVRKFSLENISFLIGWDAFQTSQIEMSSVTRLIRPRRPSERPTNGSTRRAADFY